MTKQTTERLWTENPYSEEQILAKFRRGFGELG